MSGPIHSFYPRYVLPVVPLLAIVLAYLIARGREGVLCRWSRLFTWLFLLLSIPLLIAGLLLAMADGDGLASISAILLTVMALVLAVAVFRSRSDTLLLLLCGSLLLLLPSLFLFAKPFALPDQGSQIAAKLEELRLLDGKRVAYLGKVHPAAKIRIATGPRLTLHELKSIDMERLATYDALVFLDERRPEGLLSGYSVTLASRSWSTLPVDRLLQARSMHEAAEILHRPDQIHYVAWRPTKLPTASDSTASAPRHSQ